MPGSDLRVRGALIKKPPLNPLPTRTLRRRRAGTGPSLHPTGFRRAIVPSLIVTTENHRVERIIEGDIPTRSRETDALLRRRVTLEFGKSFVRPYVARIVVANGWLTAGVRYSLTF